MLGRKGLREKGEGRRAIEQQSNRATERRELEIRSEKGEICQAKLGVRSETVASDLLNGCFTACGGCYNFNSETSHKQRSCCSTAKCPTLITLPTLPTLLTLTTLLTIYREGERVAMISLTMYKNLLASPEFLKSSSLIQIALSEEKTSLPSAVIFLI